VQVLEQLIHPLFVQVIHEALKALKVTLSRASQHLATKTGQMSHQTPNWEDEAGEA
jgi:hypothetical protein